MNFESKTFKGVLTDVWFSGISLGLVEPCDFNYIYIYIYREREREREKSTT